MCAKPCFPLSTFVRNHAKLKAIVTDMLCLGVCLGQVPLTSHRCDINEEAHPPYLCGTAVCWWDRYGIVFRAGFEDIGFSKYQKCDEEILDILTHIFCIKQL